MHFDVQRDWGNQRHDVDAAGRAPAQAYYSWPFTPASPKLLIPNALGTRRLGRGTMSRVAPNPKP